MSTSFDRESETLSRRELDKIKQAIRISERNSANKLGAPNPSKSKDSKTGKRPSSKPLLDSRGKQGRKQVKVDSVQERHCRTPSVDGVNEVADSSLDCSRVGGSSSQRDSSEREETTLNAYNRAFEIPDGETALFNYLLEYSQAQQLKLLQKQDEDWSQIAAIPGKQLVVRESSSSQALLQQISQKFAQIRDRIDGPFSEAHVKFLRAQASPFRRPK